MLINKKKTESRHCLNMINMRLIVGYEYLGREGLQFFINRLMGWPSMHLFASK